MDDSRIKKLINRRIKIERKEVKILIFASYEDKQGNDTIDSRLKDIKDYLEEILDFQTDIYLASDKKLKHRDIKKHILKYANKSDLVLITVFKDAAGMALGAELGWILDDDELVQKSILCIEKSYEISDLFTSQSNYRKIPRVSFKDGEQLKKKVRHAILDKRNELIKEFVRKHIK